MRVCISRYWLLAHVLFSALAVFACDVAYFHRPITRAACVFQQAAFALRAYQPPACFGRVRACMYQLIQLATDLLAGGLTFVYGYNSGAVVAPKRNLIVSGW